MIIYRHTGEVWKEDLEVLDTSFHEDSLQTERRLYVEYVLAGHEDVPELCYTEWEGVRYTLYKPAVVRKISTREYRYTLTFNPSEIILNDILLKFVAGDKKTKFTMTASPREFAELLASNVDGWKVGECIDADPKTISFKDDSIMSAAQRIAKEFETEVIFSNNTFSFHKLQLFAGAPLVLSYRNGLKSEIQVSPDGNEPAIGRLYVNGGERNIDRTKYNSSTLHLPKNGSLRIGEHTFITDAQGLYISLQGDTRLHTAERAFDATGVYPSRVGVVSSVEAKKKQGSDGEYSDYDIIDKDNDIDYSAYRIGGETMTVVFQSGRLAGRSFAIATKDDNLVGYNHSEKRFMLVRQEYDGVMMPEPNTFYPSVGDKYAVFGCSLPPQYIDKAEREMLKKGAEYMAERLSSRKLFKGDLDGLWAKKHWGDVGHKLVLGGTVRLTDPELGATQDVRISGIQRNLNSKYTPRLSFSNAPFIVGSISATIGTIQAKEVRIEENERYIRKLEKRSFSDIKKTKELIEGLELKQFTESISPETISTIQGIFAVPELQFQFVKGLRDPKATQFVYTWRKGGTELYVPRQYLAKLKKGKTLSANKEYDIYEIPEFTYSFKDKELSKHLYAHIGSDGNKFMLSDDPLPLTEENNLVGLVAGSADSRQITTLYGFTEITPGQIITDRIRSADGLVDINLLDGDFIIGDPSGKTCLAYIDGTLYQKGLMIGVGQGATTIEDALKEQDKKREEAIAAERAAREKATSSLSQQLATLEGKTATEEQLNQLVATVNSNHQKLQKQIDKEVSNYYAEGYPHPGRLPESEWTTEEEKERHVDDTFTSTDKSGEYAGISWRYSIDHQWVQIADTQVTKALALAAQAKSTADGKSTTHYHKPNGYQEGDSWLLQEDTEIAGKTYKAGTIVYAHATRESGFVQADWRPNAYITQQAIDDIEIGGRNYVKNSKDPRRAVGSYISYDLYNDIPPLTPFTVSFDVEVETPPNGGNFLLYLRHNNNALFYERVDYDPKRRRYSVKTTPRDVPINRILIYPNSSWVSGDKEGVGISTFSNVMVAVGNTNVGWSPAPEDLVAEMQKSLEESEKQSKAAWESYAQAKADLAQARAEATADGKITKEEQRRIDAVSNALQKAKEYAKAQDALLKTQQQAYADGKITEAEQRAIEVAKSRANLAETNAKAYADGKVTAEEQKRIAAAQKAYDDAIAKAKELDDSISIGTTNLISGTSKYARGKRFYKNIEVEGYAQVALSCYHRLVSGQNYSSIEVIDSNTKKSIYRSNTRSTEYVKVEGVITLPDECHSIDVAIYLSGNGVGDNEHKELIVVGGNKVPVTWSPSPSDIQAQIDEINRNPPRINPQTKNWEVFKFVDGVGKYVDTGDTSVGDDGKAPKIVDGYWYTWDGTKYVSTGQTAVGSDGVGIASVEIDYAESSDGVSPPDGPWSGNIPSVSPGNYLWMRTTWYYTNQTERTGYTVSRMGEDGRPGKDVDPEVLRKINKGLSDANTTIKTLQTITDGLKDGKLDAADFEGIKYLTDAFLNGKTQQIGGVVLSKSVILSNEGDKVTSLISGYDGLGGGAFARAGIKDFGTDHETANLELFHNGGAKLGDMYVVPDPDGDNDRIEFRRGNGADEHTYMQIGGRAATEHEMLTGSTIIENRMLKSVNTSESGVHFIDRFKSMENNLFVKYIAKANVRVDAISRERPGYSPSVDSGSGKKKYMAVTTSVTVTAKVLVTSKNGEIKYSNDTNSVRAVAHVPESNVLQIDTHFEHLDVSVNIPNDRITTGDIIEFFILVDGSGQFDVSTTDSYKYIPRDTSKSLVAVTKDKLSFFFGRQKYILFNYFSDIVVKVVGNVKVQGKMEVTDELKAGHIDTSGAVLCGGRVSKYGTVQTSFGRYKNDHDGDKPRVSYNDTYSYFTVYHSIPNANYVPVVTPVDVHYSDQPSVSDIQAYSFRVKFYNGDGRSYQYAFAYVCYKGD